MNGNEESPEDAVEVPPPEHSARMEGRIRAVEGILRTRQLEQDVQAGSRALQQLRGEEVLPRKRPESLQPSRPHHLSFADEQRSIHRSNPRITLEGSNNPGLTRTLAFRHTITWIAGAAAAVLFGFIALWMVASTDSSSQRLAIAEVQGDAIVEMPNGAALNTRKAEARTWLFPGQRIIVGSGGSARLRFDDDTMLELPSDSTLSLESSANGKAVKLVQGLCRFSVHQQPAGESLVIQTSGASVDVIGTTLAVASRGSETEVDVETGKVKVARAGDGREVQLNAGYSALATPDRDFSARKLTFVMGVNLGGRSVTIDGNRWLSYPEALNNGLSHGRLSVWDHPRFKLRQPQDPELTAMLQSGVWTNESVADIPCLLRQSLPNGEYKVYVWSVENATDYMRRLTLTLNGARVATGIACVPYGDWAKCGPYTTHVTDGKLDIEVGRLNNHGGERHLCGYAIYKVGE